MIDMHNIKSLTGVFTRRTLWLYLLAAACSLAGCGFEAPAADLTGRDVRLTILHTSDIHSRLLPYDHIPTVTERKLGLSDGRENYGGIARMAHVIKRERASAGRSLYLDSGDMFQGAPIFNEFSGEAEVRALTAAGLDAIALGNHEFDKGALNVVEQLERWADFPILAANYDIELRTQPFASRFDRILEPFTVFNLEGLRVGLIGMGNLSSMTSLEDGGNSTGILPLYTLQVLQDYVNILRPDVDLVIVLSHLGVSEDDYVARNVCGIDLILGGHHHVALMPPKVVHYDPDANVVLGETAPEGYEPAEDNEEYQAAKARVCPKSQQRDVIISHPNAFAKFVARLDLVVRDGRIRSHIYELFPIESTVPEDPDVAFVLEEYVQELERRYDFSRVITNASETIRRFGESGGDSMLGNLVAEAMQYRKYVETDFCMTNSLGIRTDIQEGPVTYEVMYNVLPFDNTIATMYLSGVEVLEMLNFAVWRAADRACASQIQVSNMSFTQNCRTRKAEDVVIAGQPLRMNAVYEMCTSNYLAYGGSGFKMLKRNTTKRDLGISMRDTVISYMRKFESLPSCQDGTEDLANCKMSATAAEDGRIRATF